MGMLYRTCVLLWLLLASFGGILYMPNHNWLRTFVMLAGSCMHGWPLSTACRPLDRFIRIRETRKFHAQGYFS